MCGLFGFVHYGKDKMKNLADLTNALAEQSAVRGTDATGIAFCNGLGMNVVKELRKKYNLPNTKVETDSYIAVQLIESQRKLNFGSLKYMAEKTEGSFSHSILDERNNVWLVKGDSPLSIVHFP